VEEVFRPEYKKVPMAVAGDPETRRGIILAKNELAKKYNVKTAETIWQAKKKCPGLIICKPRYKAYNEFCERVNAIYGEYTDLVERFGVDESFLDVTNSLHCFGGDPLALANEIKERIKTEIGVTISIGISWNKIFAKLGSDLKKPDAVTVITKENYKQVVWQLPVSDLLFIGRNTTQALNSFGIRTIGELANFDEEFLAKKLGKAGRQIYKFANGQDDSPVKLDGEYEPVKSVGKGLTFKRDLITERDIKTGITVLADSVAARLRAAKMKCTTIQVSIKDVEFKSIQRQKQAPVPTNVTTEIFNTALKIIKEAWSIGKPIRAITITASNLLPENMATVQLSFFEAPASADNTKAENVEKAVDAIRKKHGKGSITHASTVNNDIGAGGSHKEE
jgi:DNA polymerase-4